MSGLSVEEQLAAGASVDGLISAGVLYDDYDPDNDPDYLFTPLPTEEEIARDREKASKCTPMSDEEFEAEIALGDWYNSGRYLMEDPSNKPVLPSERQSS